MNKILGFLEEHVEKIVLGIVGLVCIWLMITRVFLSPNMVSYDGRRYSPGAIDEHIKDQATELGTILDQPPEPPEPYEPRLPEYRARLASAITGVDFGIWPPVPESDPQGRGGIRKYNLPLIGRVDDVAVGHIRAVVYAPAQEITAEIPSANVGYEPNDLDLVTVQGSFDVAGLYERFGESFAGRDVKLEWRDPCYAQPLFAAVHLQRQEMNSDSIWSEWRDVARIKIDLHRDLFEIVEKVSDLPPGGLMVRMLQYDSRDVQMDLLQPLAYQIASANEEWFPPLLHTEYKTIQKTEALEEKRRVKEEEGERRDSQSGSRRVSVSGGRRSAGGGSRGVAGGVIDAMYGGSGTSGRYDRRTGRSGSEYGDSGRLGGRTRSPRGSRRDETGFEQDYGLYGLYGESALVTGKPARPTTQDVYDELDLILINPLTDLRKMDELVFWAHDDTVEPGKTYRYRIRLGVFNPVAGKNQLSKQYASRQNDVILWSEFSDGTDVVDIPKKLYFFATGIQEAAKEVTVQVSKFVLGYWYSVNFKIRSGEVIGDLKETEAAKKPRPGVGGDLLYGTYQPADMVTEPEEIDYSTGAVLVDVRVVNDWLGGKNMRPRRYFDMLYSFDGANIEHMPVSLRYWPAELRAAHSEIINAQKEPKKPFRSMSASGRRERPMRLDYSRGRFDEDEAYMMRRLGARFEDR